LAKPKKSWAKMRANLVEGIELTEKDLTAPYASPRLNPVAGLAKNSIPM